MSSIDNLAIAEKFIASLASFDKETLSSLVSDDFVWEIAGPSLGAKPQSGKGFSEVALKMQGAKFSPGALVFNIVRRAVDGESVVLEVNTIGNTKDGKAYNNWYVHWFELQGGKIKLWREHVDSKYVLDTLWAG